MPALVATEVFAKITWVGVVPERRGAEVETECRSEIDLDWDGVVGGAHSGRNRASDSRVMQQHKRNTQIANVRQLSIVSEEEIAEIARAMNIAQFDPEWLGANLVVSGCPDFSHIPPSSRFQSENGTTLIVDMQNYPCH